MDDGDGLHDKLGGIDDVGNLQISLCQGTAWCQRVVDEILWTYLLVNSQANHNFCACFQSLLTTLLKIAVLYQKVACTSFSDVCCLFSRSSCSDTHVYGYCYILVVFSRSGLCARTACLYIFLYILHEYENVNTRMITFTIIHTFIHWIQVPIQFNITPYNATWHIWYFDLFQYNWVQVHVHMYIYTHIFNIFSASNLFAPIFVSVLRPRWSLVARITS